MALTIVRKYGHFAVSVITFLLKLGMVVPSYILITL